jgi:integrase
MSVPDSFPNIHPWRCEVNDDARASGAASGASNHCGYRTDALRRRVNRQIDRAGAKGDRQSFHSLRHTWRDALREADVSRDATLTMGGWKSGGSEEIYGGGLRPSTLAREIGQVQYPGLDLSHVHVR